jgi:hypothetical protein
MPNITPTPTTKPQELPSNHHGPKLKNFKLKTIKKAKCFYKTILKFVFFFRFVKISLKKSQFFKKVVIF